MKQNNQSSFSAWVGRFGIGREKNYVIENLSTLIASGVGVNDALDSIHSELHSLYLKKIILLEHWVALEVHQKLH